MAKIKKLDKSELQKSKILHGEEILPALDNYLKDNYIVIVGVDVPYDVLEFAGASDEAIYDGGVGKARSLGWAGSFIFWWDGEDIFQILVDPEAISLSRDNARVVLGLKRFPGLNYTPIWREPGDPEYKRLYTILKQGGLK